MIKIVTENQKKYGNKRNFYTNIHLTNGLRMEFTPETDDVTNCITHRLFNTNLQYSYAYFTPKIDEKYVVNDSFFIRFNDEALYISAHTINPSRSFACCLRYNCVIIRSVR